MAVHNSIKASERRIDKRRKTLKAGQIAMNNMCSVIECTIADISQTGARLEIPYGVEIPGTFSVSGGERVFRECAVVWRTNTQMGVRFLDTETGGKAIDRGDLVSMTADTRRALLERIDTIQYQLDAIRADLLAPSDGKAG
ncbi:MAG: PilZ domain-containing protein [Rhodospirillales bacterium]|nr:PilZ domain-containing protein [Rhodospirillales bacterium]